MPSQSSVAWSALLILIAATWPSTAVFHSPLRSKRSAQPSVTQGTAALMGCADIAYSVSAIVGNQTFELLVDTGSSTTGVASYLCTGCDTSPKYVPSPRAADLGTKVTALYADGTGWSGKATSDDFSLVGIDLSSFAFASINSQNGFFATENCVVTPGTNQLSLYDGIMGMAYPSLLLAGTQSIMDRFAVAGDLNANLFAMYMCFIDHGELSVGGLNTSVVKNQSLIFFTGLLGPSSYFYVAVRGIQVGDAGAIVTTSGQNGQPLKFIVDSGTTITYLPPSLYQAVVLAFNQNPYWIAAFGTSFFANDLCVTLPEGINETMLNAQLPVINLYFPELVMPLLPMRLLTFQVKFADNSTCYAPGIGSSADSSGFLILGITTLNQYVTIFDLANARIGFYDDPGPVCRTGLQLSATSDAWSLLAESVAVTNARVVFSLAFSVVLRMLY